MTNARKIWRAEYRNARLDRPNRQVFVQKNKEWSQRLLEMALDSKIRSELSIGTDIPTDNSKKLFQKACEVARCYSKTVIGSAAAFNYMRGGMYRVAEEAAKPRRRFVPLIKRCPVTGRPYRTSESRRILVTGLGDLVRRGVEEFEEVHGKCLPHNFIYSDGSWGPRNLAVGSAPFRRMGGAGLVSPAGADQLLKEYGRIGGWFRAAAALPGLAKLIKKSQSVNGVNSPYTTLDLRDLLGKFPHPARLERRLWAVRRRAEAILSAYPGDYHPAWSDVARALLVSHQVGKAAVITVACTLDDDCAGSQRHSGFASYRSAREFLVSVRTAAFPVVDNADGVEARREAEPCYSKAGVSVYRARVSEPHGRFSRQWIVRARDGRTFHATSHPRDGARTAVRWAIRAWRRQDELERKEGDIIAFLRGSEGFCPLVTREDSRRAGNCAAGTEAWVRRMGFAHRQWIPGEWLLPHLHDAEVRRVAYACRESLVQ